MFTSHPFNENLFTIINTIFSRVSAWGVHLILGSQRGALIRGGRSFKGGAHKKSSYTTIKLSFQLITVRILSLTTKVISVS